MTHPLLAPDYKAEPFWWDRSPRPEVEDPDLPGQTDVLVIGSGYTGLNAAIQTSRGGRRTVVIDAEAIGWGCSSRNGGQISSSIKPKYHELVPKFGGELAHGIVSEGHAALEWIGDFIAQEGIDCDFARVGRYYAAHTPARFEALARDQDKVVPGIDTGSFLVPRAEQAGEIDTDLYHGGVVHPRHASLDPGRYHNGLFDLAGQAGVQIVPQCRAFSIAGSPGRHEVDTSKGRIRAHDVIVATSGYTGDLTPWHKRRIIPIGSYVLATEPLAPSVIERLIPKNRVITDTRRLVVYYRACPDRRRIIFGGRVSISETDATRVAPQLHAELVRIFPELAATRMSHAWMGFVGYTFDSMPHLGVRDGVHYSMGYCGSGISLSSYLGRKIGLQVLGDARGDSPLGRIPFETRSYYWGKPWFLGPSIGYYRWRDRRTA
ncbi:MAG: FAD-binding oxidoreductase [Pseudomonadota bacterium]